MSTVVSADRMKTSKLASLVVAIMALLGGLAMFVPEAAASPSLESTGSSFAGVAIQQWVGQAATLYGLNINWQVSSSVVGLDNFAQNEIDFAASDIPYSSNQATSSPTQPYQYLPDVAGALAFMFNLTGTNGSQITNLVLDPQVIGDIFTGAITTWNNPAIAQLNPQLAGDLPSTTILGVYRQDASGENYLLSQYLLQMDGSAFQAFQSAVGISGTFLGAPSASWPTPPSQGFNNTNYPGWPSNMIGQAGSDNAADYVSAASSNGAITYVETAYAKEHNMPVASVINQDGNAVQPTSLNDATALEKAILYKDLTQNLAGVFTNPLANAYPVSAYSYLVTPCSPSLAQAQGSTVQCSGPTGASSFPVSKGQALGQFVAFLACAGQQQMALLGYSPLPPNLVQEDFDAVGRLNGGQQPPPVSASTCKNPYVDGQTPLPGEPTVTGVSNPNPTNQTGGGGGGGTKGTGSNSNGGGGGPNGTNGGGGSNSSGGGGGSNSNGGGGGSNSNGAKGSSKGGSKGSSGGSTPGESAAQKYLQKHAKQLQATGGDNYLRADQFREAATSALGFSSPAVQILTWCLVFGAALLVPVLVLGRRRRRTAADGGPSNEVPG